MSGPIHEVWGQFLRVYLTLKSLLVHTTPCHLLTTFLPPSHRLPPAPPSSRFLIPKERYFPPPGVDGALVTFRLLPHSARPAVPSDKGFLALVGKAFLERRKMMRNSVQPLYSTQQVGG